MYSLKLFAPFIITFFLNVEEPPRLPIQPDRQIVKLTDELTALKHELIERKKMDVFCRFYQEKGSWNSWKWSRAKVEYIGKCINKYKHLAGKEGKVKIYSFSFSRTHSESDGREYLIVKEPDGTLSYGIWQMNSTCIFMIEQIINKKFPELRYKDARFDIEKNIACGMYWIQFKKDIGQEWAILRPSAWDMYDLMEKVKM